MDDSGFRLEYFIGWGTLFSMKPILADLEGLTRNLLLCDMVVDWIWCFVIRLGTIQLTQHSCLECETFRITILSFIFAFWNDFDSLSWPNSELNLYWKVLVHTMWRENAAILQDKRCPKLTSKAGNFSYFVVESHFQRFFPIILRCLKTVLKHILCSKSISRTVD